MREKGLTTPTGYVTISTTGLMAGALAFQKKNGLRVIVSDGVEVDGRLWRHISLSYEDKIPVYSDIIEVKNSFASAHRYAVMIFPKKRDHVNCHPFCLHLFALLEGTWPLPDFTRGKGSL